jgi:hypothetical protein
MNFTPAPIFDSTFTDMRQPAGVRQYISGLFTKFQSSKLLGKWENRVLGNISV